MRKNRQKKDKTQEETKVEEQRRRISSVPDLAEVEKREKPLKTQERVRKCTARYVFFAAGSGRNRSSCCNAVSAGTAGDGNEHGADAL